MVIQEDIRPSVSSSSSSHKQKIRNILLATDGSSFAELAFENCIRLVGYAGGKLIITYYTHAVGDTTEVPQTLEQLEKRAKESGIENVETIIDNYQDEDALNRLAERVKADLIVIASHLFSSI
jgi:nucleotide-binding universal stress UspA family protein